MGEGVALPRTTCLRVLSLPGVMSMILTETRICRPIIGLKIDIQIVFELKALKNTRQTAGMRRTS